MLSPLAIAELQLTRKIEPKQVVTSVPEIEKCPRDNKPAREGSGAHLGLRNPWWNDASHTVTDSTIFRLLLILMVVDFVLKKIG